MTDRLRLWYAALSRREQWLVAIAGVLALATIVWATAVLTLGAMQSAHSRHADAVRRLADTDARVKAVVEETRDRVAPPSGPLDTAIRDRAATAGFTLASDTLQADGSVDIAIASARAPVLFGWVAGLERDGLIVQRLAASDNGDRTLAVQMTLKKRGS